MVDERGLEKRICAVLWEIENYSEKPSWKICVGKHYWRMVTLSGCNIIASHDKEEISVSEMKASAKPMAEFYS